MQHPLLILFALLLALVTGGLFYFGEASFLTQSSGGYSFEVNNKDGNDSEVLYGQHPLTGKRCEGSSQRPIAVMMPSDGPTRPLSGLSKADLVVEMPVTQPAQGGITRMMALYACEQPETIGSVRSARDDFIPLAASFDAIYAHWGGSHFALDDLKLGLVPDIDALVNPHSAFYRKSWIARPHNGFTGFGRLYNASEKLGYRLENNFEGYPHINGQPRKEEGPTTLSVNYNYPYNVSYIYDPDKNVYARWRGGQPEKDMLDKSQVEASVVVVMQTNMRQIEGQYNDVDVYGSGDAFIFQNGTVQKARWEKKHESARSKLAFYDSQGSEIGFVSGNLWLQVADKNTAITWGDERL